MQTTPEGLVYVSEEVRARIAYEATLDEDSCCSFAEWSAAGYMIKQGERSIFRDVLGIPQFTKEQVFKKSSRPPPSYHEH